MGNDIRFGAIFDVGDVGKKLKQLNKDFEKLGGKGSGASLFGNVGAKAVAKGFDLISSAASIAIDFAFDSIKAFDQLQQATGGLEAVFGDSGGAIEDFAETSATSFGISKRAAFEMATVIGAKLQGMGMDVDEAALTVVALEKRGADMAATFGGTAVDAIAAMSSALTGERDAIEKYGVSIKEADVQARILELGLANVTAEEQKQAVATATLSLIMEQTSKTAGAFAKETDTLAGKQSIANAKMEEAQAALGEKLAPLMMSFTQFMIDVGIPALMTLAEEVGKISDEFRQLAEDIYNAYIELLRFLGKASENPYVVGKFDPKYHNKGNLPAPVPHAEGGWAGLHGPELALLGERGPEYVRKAGTGTGDGGHGHDIIIDGEKVARAVDERLSRRFRRAAVTSGSV